MNKRQRDNLVKFFYTLSTASFTGFVIATILSRPASIELSVIGALMVIIFALIAYKVDGLEIESKGES